MKIVDCINMNQKLYLYLSKLEEIASKLCLQFSELSSSQITQNIKDIISYYKSMLDALREQSNALIVFNNFEINPYPLREFLIHKKSMAYLTL